MKKLFPVLLGILLSLLVGIAAVSAQNREVRTVNGGVLNGKAISLPKPEYPDEAKKAGAEGAIAVSVTIDEEGNVTSATAAKYQPVMKTEESGTDGTAEAKPTHPLLSEAAEKAAMGAKFSPTLLSGQPVKVSGVIVYNFVAAGGSPENTVKTVSGGVLNGKAQSLPLPVYPPAAKAVGAGGAVSVQVLIDEDGNVSSASAISGHPLLRSAAVDVALQAKFAPTLLNGQPVKVNGVLTYNFVP
jgi:TonB family protein